MKKTKFLPFLLFTFLFTNFIFAQGIEDYLNSYTGENGKGYMQPFADAFGANVNSGFFHSADIPLVGIKVYVGVVTMTAFIADDAKSFQASTGEFFNPSTTLEAPTIFGSIDGTTVNGSAGTTYHFPGGLNISKLPIAVPQLTVGSFMGTDATLRFIQLNLGDNFGDLSVFGIGLRHSISQYIPLLPLKIAGGIYYQTFKVGDVVDASAFFISAQASYSLPVITLYGGLGYESSSMDLNYKFGSGDTAEEISFNLTAENTVRLTLGAALKLAFITLNADYNIGNQNVLVLGLGFEF